MVGRLLAEREPQASLGKVQADGIDRGTISGGHEGHARADVDNAIEGAAPSSAWLDMAVSGTLERRNRGVRQAGDAGRADCEKDARGSVVMISDGCIAECFNRLGTLNFFPKEEGVLLELGKLLGKP